MCEHSTKNRFLSCILLGACLRDLVRGGEVWELISECTSTIHSAEIVDCVCDAIRDSIPPSFTQAARKQSTIAILQLYEEEKGRDAALAILKDAIKLIRSPCW